MRFAFCLVNVLDLGIGSCDLECIVYLVKFGLLVESTAV